ncbi:MAG: ABC transporter permease [Candidatus Zixiibacteriota bacterium]
MKWKNLFKVAYKSVLKNRMRSALTSLGIIIGVGAVIIMVAIGEGSQRRILNQINSLGADMIMVFPAHSRMGGISRGSGSQNRMTLEDADYLAENVTLCRAISPVVGAGGQVVGGTSNWNTSIYGVSPSYLTIRSWSLSSGEFFTDRDIRARSKVCVLGKTVADSLFSGVDPIGEQIRIRSTPFKVIGVLAEKGQNPMGRDEDDIILAPSTTVLYRLAGGQYINQILASANTTAVIKDAQVEIETLMRTAHKIQEGEEDDFMVRNQADITNAVSESSEILTMLLGSIAAVSLLVGGIGIMNIMLVSVTERTREIGIRLAIGARGSDVLIQFLTEAVVLSFSGGIIGILLSFGTVYALNHFFDISAVINIWIVTLAAAFSAAVGIFFGFYPARKAAALNPIDALRYE